MIHTTLHVFDQLPAPGEGQVSLDYCFVEFDAGLAQMYLDSTSLELLMDDNAQIAKKGAKVMALEPLETFCAVLKPELEKVGAEFSNHLKDVKRFRYISEIFSEPDYQKIPKKAAKLMLSKHNEKPDIHVFTNVKAGDVIDSSDTVVVIKADENQRVVDYAPSQSRFYYTASEELMLVMDFESYKNCCDDIERDFNSLHIKKNYYGDSKSLFFGADKRPIVQMVKPGEDNEAVIITNKASNEPTLMVSGLVQKNQNSMGESVIHKVAATWERGGLRVRSFAALDLSFRPSTDQEKESFMSRGMPGATDLRKTLNTNNIFVDDLDTLVKSRPLFNQSPPTTKIDNLANEPEL